MNYPFENLGPEKFQLFCQSLLAREHPNLQCLPVAQPDGGRDAVQWQPPLSPRGFIVFQVKYVRAPLAERESHKWLEGIIQDELPKVEKLIPRGAKQYVLMTNIPGTAHLESGSIDSVNSLLEQLGIPAVCWWRDDLNRRLDNAWDLKWVYPELMTGPDLIRALIETGNSENNNRRLAAIRAFVAHQYSVEDEVRFKQVELQNRLLDLFIDVPIAGRAFTRMGTWEHLPSQDDYADSNSAYYSDELEHTVVFGQAGLYYRQRPRSVGAATFLLGPRIQGVPLKAVLEGAPGQGKSTISDSDPRIE